MDDIIFELLNCFSKRNNLSAEKLGVIYNTDYLEFGGPLSLMIEKEYLTKDDPFEKYPDDLIYPECHYQITFKGKIALSEERKNRKRFKHSEFRAWVSLFIAGIALIVSIISIAIQLT